MSKKNPGTKGGDSNETRSKGSFADAMANVDDVSPIDRTNVSKTPILAPSKPTHLSDRGPVESNPNRMPATDKRSRVVASRAQLRSLRAGKIRPQQTIDLHGFTLDQAYRRLCNAIARASDSGFRCVVVIHGKGQHSTPGTLTIKEALAGWLEESPLAEQVTGNSLAQPRDGGGGASYLLLRDQMRNKVQDK